MSFIDKIILRILILASRRFFDCIELFTDETEENVVRIEMYKENDKETKHGQNKPSPDIC